MGSVKIKRLFWIERSISDERRNWTRDSPWCPLWMGLK